MKNEDAKLAMLRSRKAKQATPPTTFVEMKQPTKIADLISAPYNPRTITEAQLEGLKSSLDEYGDIGGITWNVRTGHLVTGHQRVQALREQYGEENLKITFGEIQTPSGERFPIRVVDWDEEREKTANIAANSMDISGTYDWEALSSLLKALEASSVDLDLTKLAPETLEPLLAAEWQPPAIDDSYNDGEAGGVDGAPGGNGADVGGLTLQVPEESVGAVLAAFDAARVMYDMESASHVDVLIKMCEAAPDDTD